MGEERSWRAAVIRLHVTAEGQTEKAFVSRVLAPHLAAFGVYADARCVLTGRDKRVSKEYRGGLLSYQKAKADIQTWMKEDRDSNCRFTTMFDLYALPDDFPNYRQANQQDAYSRVQMLEDAFLNDVKDERFIPYIQLHEFEALIFSDPAKLDWEYLEHDTAIASLVSMAEDQNPELINDGKETAPSKRIFNALSDYDKVSAGVSVVEHIGLQKLREKCRHFNEWVTQLENLSR
nr:DUF4276 family protein [Xenorhabdus aichiensis]